MSATRPTTPKHTARRPWAGLAMALLILIGSSGTTRPGTVGADLAANVSLCERELVDPDPLAECEASDIRFQAAMGDGTTPSQSDFGFAIDSGHLNGDAFEDLVVGDPARNRVYIFFGRPSLTASYGLDDLSLDRGVDAEAADVILDAGIAGQLGSFGYAVAVGREGTAGACGPDDRAFPLVVGAPGRPGTSGNPPGAVIYLPAGSLCMTASDPPDPTTIDPLTLGQVIRGPVVEQDDEFGYSVELGRFLTTSGSDEDVIVGARTAGGGTGKVTIFPVNAGVVGMAINAVVEIHGLEGDGLGEALAVGDVDGDFDAEFDPGGAVDDLAIGAVGNENGKALVIRGPLSPQGGRNADGVYREGEDSRISRILGEQPGDFFGFSVAIAGDGSLAVGAIFADNETPAPEGQDTGSGGNPLTNVDAPRRINAGKLYVWSADTFVVEAPEVDADTADTVLVAHRSGDQLGFAVKFADMDGSGEDDLIVSARREDGSGRTVDEIDQGTIYLLFDATALTSPVDLGQCATASDCTGVAGVDVMVFGGDRALDLGDEVGFALAVGDFNGDAAEDLFASSRTHKRVYAVTLEDSDDDLEERGRNLRDDDDDNDGDPDSTDCMPLDPDFVSGAEEIPCNGIDENCNGLEDDTPDADGDGFDVCGDEETAADCDDDDPASFPEGNEVCDGNDNDCDSVIPDDELDGDDDGYVACAGWDDTQGDDEAILGSGDCAPASGTTFPGAAAQETDPTACMSDADEDDFGDSSPAEGVTPGSDCDDDAPGTFPGAAPHDDAQSCMRDEDDDDFGDSSPPAGVVAGSDCDDSDPRSFPAAPERCDGNDNACSGSVPDNETDSDGDHFVACANWNDTQGDDAGISGGGDCAPMDSSTFPGAAPAESVSTACMRDGDGDGFGALMPPAGVTAGTDCNDAAADTFPGAAPRDSAVSCMKDSDADDFGDENVSLPVVPGSDCNDDDAGRNIGAVDRPGDGIDQDCNGFDTVVCYVDADGDGFGGQTSLLAADGDCTDDGESAVDTDCDDTDETVFEGQPEIADDGIDQDCNGFDTITCFVDADEDGFGMVGATVLADDGSCDAEQQESASEDDCNDADDQTFPGAAELCDGNDNSCAGGVGADERDGDGDGFVPCSGWDDTQGDDPAILGGDDCNDSRSNTYPGAAENESLGDACMQDADGDGFGEVSPPPGVTAGTDCDDTSASAAVTFPGAAAIDGPFNCMKDADGDEHGDSAVSLPVVAGTDCDDDDPTSFPGAAEVCDGNDNACSGSVPANETDPDGDNRVGCFSWNDTQGDNPTIVAGGDCDQTDADTYRGAAPKDFVPLACMRDKDGDDYGDFNPPPGVVAGTDCDDVSPTAAVTFPGAAAIDGPLNCMKDADDDDFGDSAVTLPVVRGRDCDDDDPTLNPGVLEGPQGDATCSDARDNDCDGLVDLDDPVCSGTQIPCPDVDGDDWADCTTDPSCDPTGVTCGDCDDGDPTVSPSAAEVCDNKDNDCNTTIDEGFDQDDDGYTTCDLPAPDCNDAAPAINPGAIELCGDSVDNDCNPATLDLFDGDSDSATCDVDCNDGDPALNLDDADSDGFSTCQGDCNDALASVNPGATEVCADGVDNDCDAGTPDIFDADDDGASCDLDCADNDASLNLLDADMDTFTSCAGDCDDANSAIHPGATEVCDGVDNNCDGVLDEPFDLDMDGFSTCAQPIADCNDTDPDINPGADELCNDAIDNDCNPATPDVADADSDGATCIIDCDESDPNSYPGAVERCDGNDNSCGGTVPANEIDTDGDGYVACGSWVDSQGDDPTILGGGDCDATDADTFPGSSPNESFSSACMRDKDGDDYGDLAPPAGVVGGTDCDDTSAFAADTFPGAAAIDGPFNCMKDSDGDNYGDAAVSLPVVAGGDCNDGNAAVNPGVLEGPMGDAVCSDGVDNDCDALVDLADPQCSSAATRKADRPVRLQQPERPSRRGRR